jgi:hypothetical protein
MNVYSFTLVLPNILSNFLNKLMVCTMQLNNFQGMQSISLCCNTCHYYIYPIYCLLQQLICWAHKTCSILYTELTKSSWVTLWQFRTKAGRMFWIEVAASCLKRLYYSIALRVGDIILPHAWKFQSLAPILPKSSKKPSTGTFTWQTFWSIIQ